MTKNTIEIDVIDNGIVCHVYLNNIENFGTELETTFQKHDSQEFVIFKHLKLAKYLLMIKYIHKLYNMLSIDNMW